MNIQFLIARTSLKSAVPLLQRAQLEVDKFLATHPAHTADQARQSQVTKTEIMVSLTQASAGVTACDALDAVFK